MAVVQDINQAKAKHVNDVGGKWYQEEEEIAIIPPTNAVVHPGTVVVKILRAQGQRLCKHQGGYDRKEIKDHMQNIK